MLFSKNYISGEDAVGYNDASHIAILGMNLAEVTDIFLIQFRKLKLQIVERVLRRNHETVR